MDNSPLLKPVTSSGAAWVKAYTHPPTEVSGVEGIPDHSTQSSTVVDFRNEFTVTPPAAVTGTWSVLLISLPNPQVPVVGFRWLGDVPPNPIPAADILTFTNGSFVWGLDAVNWEINAARYRPVKKSSTYYFDGASLYNQGKVWASSTGFSYELDRVEIATPGFPADALAYVADLGYLPIDGTLVMQSSSKYYSGLAKDGCFQVSHFVDPAVQYETASATGVTLQFRHPNAATQRVLLISSGGIVIAPSYAGMSLGYTLFKGLLPQVTVSAKAIHSWEIVPDPASAWAPFAKPGPCPDSGALELAAVEMFKMPDGFPSASNDFGAFLNAAKSLGPVLKSVWGVTKPALKAGLSALPAGGLINQVIDEVEKLAVSRTPNRQRAKKGVQAVKPTLRAPFINMSLREKEDAGIELTKSQKKRLMRQRMKQ